MSTQVVTADDIDLSIAFWREEGRWMVAPLQARSATSLDDVVGALRQLPGEGGVFGAVCVADEFFVLLRESGAGRWAMVSDGAAVLDWSLAEEALDLIGIQLDEDDIEEFEPVGDVSMLAEFGIDADEIALICQNDDLYPDDQIKQIAKQLGFHAELAAALRS
jgi:putative tRNA adenosine deaminase-associated protein